MSFHVGDRIGWLLGASSPAGLGWACVLFLALVGVGRGGLGNLLSPAISLHGSTIAGFLESLSPVACPLSRFLDSLFS